MTRVTTPSNRNLDSRISDKDIKIASARSVREWMDIYIEILIASLQEIEKQHPGDSGIYEKFRTESRPRLRRLVRDFETAGLSLTDEIEFEGCHIVPGQPHPIWENSNRPCISFIWPDGQTLQFVGADAISAVGFMIFWMAHQDAVLGAKQDQPTGESRLILPGEADHKAYFDAKLKDLKENSKRKSPGE